MTNLSLVMAIFLLLISWVNASAVELKPYNSSYVSKGKSVYRSHCAACHGFSMKGQRKWKRRKANGRLPAPPHDASGHTWHHTGRQLFDLTKFGPKSLNGDDYQTDMPAYKDILSDEEIIAVLSYIKSKWPNDIRARHDAMEKKAREK